MSVKSFVHPKMNREERAKQFMPFAALKGYEDALRAKEAEMLNLAENQLTGEKYYDSDYTESDFLDYDFGDN